MGDRIAELLMRSFLLLVEENKNKKLEFNFNPNAFLIISEDRSLVMEFVNSVVEGMGSKFQKEMGKPYNIFELQINRQGV